MVTTPRPYPSKSFRPIYGGLAPGFNHKSAGHYTIYDHKVMKVVTKLILGQHPIFFSKLTISLPAIPAKEHFRWTAYIKTHNSYTREDHYLDGIVRDKVYIDSIKQNKPFKWGKDDEIEMFTMFVFE